MNFAASQRHGFEDTLIPEFRFLIRFLAWLASFTGLFVAGIALALFHQSSGALRSDEVTTLAIWPSFPAVYNNYLHLLSAIAGSYTSEVHAIRLNPSIKRQSSIESRTF